ncbi:TPA_asm: relaxase/mobilization nuclease domain-containing protein, partial [Listeria monocytogenes]|nr:relaxase/mobilization nuclease domain-containing protein [Listeria monocytogenes]
LITTFECSVESIERDFKNALMDYNEANNKNRELTSRMIIQSFDKDDNLTPEKAHAIGVEFADKYLKGKHQYLVVTHIETDNIHNHIIFNDIDFENNKIFDSKRENTLHNLRLINREISELYSLSQISLSKSDKKYIAFNEYVARAKGTSFKSQLENAIDINIQKANSFDEFLEFMKADGYEHKQGKYLAFENNKSKKFMRTKTLGMNYLESSIKYRIEHKDYQPLQVDIVNKKWIDKSQEKFKNNKGLERWATVQNINYLNEINAHLYKNKMTLKELDEIKSNAESFIDNFNKQLLKIDDEIYTLEKMAGSFKEYKDSYSIMYSYKAAETEEERNKIKHDNNHVFRRYDIVKRNIKFLKSKYNISDEAELQRKLSTLKNDRNLLYGSLNVKGENVIDLEHLEQQKNRERKEHHSL